MIANRRTEPNPIGLMNDSPTFIDFNMICIFEQMEQINAGWPDWLVNAWNAVCDFFYDVYAWVSSCWQSTGISNFYLYYNPITGQLEGGWEW